MQSNLNGDFLKVNKDLWRDLQTLLDSLKKYTWSTDRSNEDSILLVLSKIFASYEDNNIESSDDDAIIAVQSFLLKYVNSDTTIYALYDCIFLCYCSSIDEGYWGDWDVTDELITNSLISSDKRDLHYKNYAPWMIEAMTSNADAYFPSGVYYAEMCLDLKVLVKRINDIFKLNSHEISSNERLLCRLLTLFERIGYYKVTTAETTLVMGFKYFLHEYIDETKLAYYALMRLTFTTYSEISWAYDYADRVLLQLEELVCGKAWKELGLLPKLLPFQCNFSGVDNRPRCNHTDFESGFFGATDSDEFEIRNEVVFECECNRAFYCSERCRVNCIRSHFPICCRIREARLKEKCKVDIVSKIGVDNSFVTISQFLLVAQRGWIDSICSLRSLGACCKLFQGFFHTSSFAKIILNTNLHKIVQKFGFDSLTDFNDIIRQEKIGLAGSTPLQALLGEDFGDAADMDFYIVMDEGQDYYLTSTIHFHLENMGYTCTRATSGCFRYEDWLFQNAYHMIHYYSNKQIGRAIQVMCVKKTTATTGFKDVVNLYDFSFVKNWYDGYRFYFLFPDDCITKTGKFSSNRLQSIIDLKISLAQRLYCCPVWNSRVLRESGCFADIKTLEKHFLRILERTRKYESRGFIIVGPQVPKRSNFINGEKHWILYGNTAEFQAFNYLSLNDY